MRPHPHGSRADAGGETIIRMEDLFSADRYERYLSSSSIARASHAPTVVL